VKVASGICVAICEKGILATPPQMAGFQPLVAVVIFCFKQEE